jgi:hypothetical protein
MNGHLTAQQIDFLLEPIQPQRVKTADGQSYLPQQDVRAHLTRVFGFCGWSSTVTDSSMIAEDYVTWADKRSGQQKSGYDALWRARVRITLRDPEGVELAQYEDEATGEATHQPSKAAAHDLALKSAVSTALKRAATSLGDQFGLSLYNKGSRDQFVCFTLVGPQETISNQVPAATEDHEQAEALTNTGTDAVAEAAPHPSQIPPEQHRENARAYAAQQQAARRAEPQPDPQPDPVDTMEEAIARAQAAQNQRNMQRHGPEINCAKARAVDAVHYARPDLTWDQAVDLIRATLASDFDLKMDRAEPWHFNHIGAQFENEELDRIRAEYAK